MSYDVKWPNEIALDLVRKRVYWVSAVRGQWNELGIILIESLSSRVDQYVCSCDGTHRQTEYWMAFYTIRGMASQAMHSTSASGYEESFIPVKN